MLLKPAVYFDGNQVEIMKLHKSSPYSKICLNLGALHPSSPEKHLMIIWTLWPDPRCTGDRLKNEGQKSTQWRCLESTYPLALLHNANWKLYSHPKKISCWVLLLTSPKKLKSYTCPLNTGHFKMERIVFQSHHFLTRHVSFRGGYKFQKKTSPSFIEVPSQVEFLEYPPGNHIYPTKREVRKRIDSKVPAGMGYASYHQSLKRRTFWGPP